MKRADHDRLTTGVRHGHYWLRCKTDHTILIHSHDGRHARRDDGEPWEHGGYKVEQKLTGDGFTLQPTGGYAD